MSNIKIYLNSNTLLELLLITTDSRTLKFQGISYERAADESKPFFVKPIDIRRKMSYLCN